MTPADVSAQLADLSRELGQTRIELAGLDDRFVRAEHIHRVGFARAFMAAEGSMDARKQLATIATDEIRLAAELAGASHRACQERLREIRSRLDVGRTLSAAIRVEYAAS